VSQKARKNGLANHLISRIVTARDSFELRYLIP